MATEQPAYLCPECSYDMRGVPSCAYCDPWPALQQAQLARGEAKRMAKHKAYTGFAIRNIAGRLMRLADESDDFYDSIYLLEAARLLVEMHAERNGNP